MTKRAHNILIVEDNPVLGKVMERSFATFGYKCRSANSAQEALLMLEQYTPDIILSDYEMPGINGFDFRQRLLQHPIWKNIPFVFLTAYSDEELVLKGLHLHALDYIIKGTPFPVIASKIDNILNSLQQEHERSVEELKKAAEMLQVTSIPKESPFIPGYSVHFWNQSYQNYPGGDFMDYIKVDDRYTFLFIGDIMGKKWQAWFFTFGYLSYIRSAIRFCILDRNLHCLEIMQKVNKVICQDESLKDILSSLSLLMLDKETGMVTYTGAGDLPLVHYSYATQTAKPVISSGLLLGLMEDGLYNEQIIQLESGDRLLAFTDGLTDLMEDGHKTTSFASFVDRFTTMLQQYQSFDNVKNNLLAELSDNRQVDDASLIFIERKTIAQ